ncbi:MAG: hypothetical protein HYZ29_20785 [Myxococcales bacterium]|nr:hypothetical protein [Myxococcales bacterium]
MRRTFSVALAAVVLMVVAQACMRESETPRQPATGAATGYPPPTYGPAPPPTAPGPPAPGPTTPPPTPPEGPASAAGLPCSSDADFICPFGRCLGGRCGGCRRETDCKPGATCANTPVGMTCVPSATPAPPPPSTAPPAPPPAPPATTPPATPPAPPPAADSFAAARERCLKRTNEYRATKSLPALSLRSESSSCADGQAQSDATSKKPHGSFGKCSELAQNECPGWKGSTDTVVDTCLKAMFDEGPGSGPTHGHHNNIMDPTYSSVSCGFFVEADGTVWLVQNFHR